MTDTFCHFLPFFFFFVRGFFDLYFLVVVIVFGMSLHKVGTVETSTSTELLRE